MYIGSRAFFENQLVNVVIGNGVTNLDGFGGNRLTSVTISGQCYLYRGVGIFRKPVGQC